MSRASLSLANDGSKASDENKPGQLTVTAHTSLRFAFIGGGWIVRTVWLPLLRQAGAEIVAVIDPDPAAAQSFAQLSTVRISTDLTAEAMAGCDVAFICSPNAYHVEHALAALALGLHVVLEKPACFNLATADQLIAASRACKRAIVVTSASSHRLDAAHLITVSQSGDLGRVHCIDASWRRRAGIPRPGSWFTDERLAIGGSGADLGWHLLEVALGALDFPLIKNGSHQSIRPANVPAHEIAAWRAEEPMGGGPLSVDTQMFACLQTDSGALVRLTTAWCSEVAADETKFAVYGSAGEMQAVGTFGFSTATSGQHAVTMFKQGTYSLPCAEEKMAPYRNFIGATLDYLDAPWRDTDASTLRIHRQLRSLGSAMAVLYPQTAAQMEPLCPG